MKQKISKAVRYKEQIEKYEEQIAIFGENVKRLRLRKGLTQKDLAIETNLSLRTIQRIENGQVTLIITSVFMIAEALETPVTSLFKNIVL